MFPKEIQRLKHLLALIKQFNRLKFENLIPPQFIAAVATIENLIPEELRGVSYCRYEMGASTHDFIAETITSILEKGAKRSMTRQVTKAFEELLRSNIWEGDGFSDVNPETSASTTLEVPDMDGPRAKRAKNGDDSDEERELCDSEL